MPMNIEEIKEILPHRYPFLLIDRVVEVNDSYCLAIKNVSINEPFFQGHFPKMAVMPGVLQVEAMAQAAGILLKKDEHGLGLLVGIDDAKFKQKITPGDQLKIKVSLLNKKGQLAKVKGEITVDEKLASSAIITIFWSKS